MALPQDPRVYEASRDLSGVLFLLAVKCRGFPRGPPHVSGSRKCKVSGAGLLTRCGSPKGRYLGVAKWLNADPSRHCWAPQAGWRLGVNHTHQPDLSEHRCVLLTQRPCCLARALHARMSPTTDTTLGPQVNLARPDGEVALV